MSSDTSSHFSKEEAEQFEYWPLPDISSAPTVPSAEKERQEQQRIDEEQQALHGPLNPQAGESIDEEAQAQVQALTADQLQAITEAAEKEGYEAGYNKGLEEGVNEGRKSGYEEGLSSGKQEAAERVERLQRLLEALLMPLEQDQKALQTLLVDMVCQLSEAIVRRELQMDSSQVIQLVEEALATIPPGSERLNLSLNPSDASLVEESLKEQGFQQKLSYQVDEELLPGGCRLESLNSRVDNSVEKRLNLVLEGFQQKQFVDARQKSDVENQQLELEAGEEKTRRSEIQPTENEAKESVKTEAAQLKEQLKEEIEPQDEESEEAEELPVENQADTALDSRTSEADKGEDQ